MCGNEYASTWLLGLTKIEAFELGVAILEKQLFLPNRPVSMFADNDISNPLSF